MLFRSSLRRALPFLSSLRLLVALAAPLLLAACGDLPEPFIGNPGALARRLAVPMTPMLAVPPTSPDSLLTAPADHDFADLLSDGLRKEGVPTLVRPPRKTDWRLAVTAGRRGEEVVPRYAILDPSGHEQGAIDGMALAAANWTSGGHSTLNTVAQEAVPKILALMMSVRATRDRANPNSLLNRVATLFVPAVTGAPGDGDPALTGLIRARLAEFGPLVQVSPEGADFTVTGVVVVTPLPKGQQQVEIGWTVTRPSGVVVGKVSQLNSVPAGSLDHLWGDVASVVAQEASAGINTVVDRFIGRGEKASAATAAAGTGPGGPVSGMGSAVGKPAVGTEAPRGAGATKAAGTVGGATASPAPNGATGATTIPGPSGATGTTSTPGLSGGAGPTGAPAVNGFAGKANPPSSALGIVAAPAAASRGKAIAPAAAGPATDPFAVSATASSSSKGKTPARRTSVVKRNAVGEGAVPPSATAPGDLGTAVYPTPGKAIVHRISRDRAAPARPTLPDNAPTIQNGPVSVGSPKPATN